MSKPSNSKDTSLDITEFILAQTKQAKSGRTTPKMSESPRESQIESVPEAEIVEPSEIAKSGEIKDTGESATSQQEELEDTEAGEAVESTEPVESTQPVTESVEVVEPGEAEETPQSPKQSPPIPLPDEEAGVILEEPKESPGLRRSRRPHKAPKRFDETIEAPLVVPEGEGIPLHKIPAVIHQVRHASFPALRTLHSILLKRRGKTHDLKNDLLQWKGIPNPDDVENPVLVTMVEKLDDLETDGLEEICRTFSLDDQGTPKELLDRIVEFVKRPFVVEFREYGQGHVFKTKKKVESKESSSEDELAPAPKKVRIEESKDVEEGDITI